MADEVFANVPSEGNVLDIDKAFERLENKGDETSTDSQADKKQAQEPSGQGENTVSEKPEPFHKHPRWIKTQDELKDLREKVAKYEADRTASTPELPKWWKDQYGDTDESKQRYQAVVAKDGELDWIKDSIIREIEQKSQAETQQSQAAEEYVNTQLSEMTDEGLKFERNKLLKFMVDFQEEYGSGSLLDPEGNYDFRKSLKLMNQLQPDEVEDKTVQKQLASQAGRTKASPTKSSGVPVVSSRALRKGNWRDADTGQFTSS